MDQPDDLAFDIWLAEADGDFTYLVVERLDDTEESLASVKREAARQVVGARAVDAPALVTVGARTDPVGGLFDHVSRDIRREKPDQAPPLDAAIRAAIRGDRLAVESVLTWMQPRLVRYCRGQLGRHNDTYGAADEVARQACLAVLDALPTYQPGHQPFPRFMYDIAARKVTESPLAALVQPSPVPAAGTSSDAVFSRLKSAAFHELVSAAMAGDQDATGTLFVWIHPAVVRYCRARIGRTGAAYSTADDLAQEVCLAVLGALPRYDDQPESFLPFIYGIAAHKVTDHYRKAARNKAEPAAPGPEGINLNASPEQMHQTDTRTRLARLLDTLAPRQREILVLRLIVGLSAQETAVAIGLTATAVRVAQHRALAKLRDGLSLSDWL